jgi:hypothetical protein
VSLSAAWAGAAAAPKSPPRPSDKEVAEARAVFERLLKPRELAAEDKQRVDALLRDLGSASWAVRERATAELSRMGPQIAPLMQPAAESGDPEVAIRAERVLREIEARGQDVGAELDGAIETLVAAGDRKVVGLLIELLGQARTSTRYAAEYGLRRITGQAFGFSAYEAAAERARAAASWRKWWQAHEGTFEFAKAGTSQRHFHVLLPDDEASKLVLVDAAGKVLWSRRLDDKPLAAELLPNGGCLVGYSSQGVREYDRAGKEVWCDRKFNIGSGMIYDVQRLPNGNTLVAYVGAGHVSEVTPGGKVVWQMTGLKAPGAARRLPNGNTLICENHGNRIIEVNSDRNVVWEKGGLSNPSDAMKLPNGNVLIAEWGANRVIEVDRAGQIVWQRDDISQPAGACRLGDGTTVINSKEAGVTLIGRDGKTVRKLLDEGGHYAKIRLVPAAFTEALAAPQAEK